MGLSTPIAGVQALTLLYLSVLVPAMLTVTLIYGRGYARTFAIGALFPAGVAFFSAFGNSVDNLFNSNTFLRYEEPAPVMVLAVAIALVLTVLAGLIAMGMRWMVESARGTGPSEAARKPLRLMHTNRRSQPLNSCRGRFHVKPPEGD